MSKKRYVQIGLGSRSEMYSIALVESFKDQHELVGLCDTNPGRLQNRADWAKEHGVEVRTYAANEFDRMIAECTPDWVIVTPPDYMHDLYICRAMELGCDVITEKAMAVKVPFRNISTKESVVTLKVRTSSAIR